MSGINNHDIKTNRIIILAPNIYMLDLWLCLLSIQIFIGILLYMAALGLCFFMTWYL